MAQSQTARVTATIAARGTEATPFHKDMLNVMQAGKRSQETMLQKLQALLHSKYGECMPTIIQYTADQSALKLLAEQRDMADNQWVRKPYAAAVRATYGALPVSTGADAEAKRMTRYAPAQRAAFTAELARLEAIDRENGTTRPHHVYQALAHECAQGTKTPKVQATVGAPVGQVKDQQPSERETVSQFIARVGPHAVLAELSAILSADKSTKTQAMTLKAIDNQLAALSKTAA